jgi:hypothetical protein|tara:strand:+ start:667 stop:1008 length:342 start_codon:yes stop_codon:yes gene_type:complete
MTPPLPSRNLEQEFERLQSMLELLRKKMTKGAVIDLAGLDHEIAALCQKLSTLPDDQQRLFKTQMTSLLSDVTQVSEEMKVELGRLAQEIGSTSQRKKAVNAYSSASLQGKKR